MKLFLFYIGEHLSDEEVADMIRVADEDGDGRINFSEFKTIMEFVVSIFYNILMENQSQFDQMNDVLKQFTSISISQKTGKSSKLNPSVNRTSNQNVNEKHVKKK